MTHRWPRAVTALRSFAEDVDAEDVLHGDDGTGRARRHPAGALMRRDRYWMMMPTALTALFPKRSRAETKSVPSVCGLAGMRATPDWSV